MNPAFDNSYARHPAHFFARVRPTPVRAPRVIAVNVALAEQLGFDPALLASDEGARLLAGNTLFDGSEPIALAYAGHQFGHFVPQLGDGRAVLLGEVVDRNGVRFDVQLKGAGQTPFSRRGDGRAALGPVLREYVVSEAMAALGIPTTRALAAVLTGETVYREMGRLPGAVLTRVAASHLRVGTFEFFAARDDREALSTLTTYALTRHYPNAVGSGNDALALLDCVIDAQADLVAQWLGVGFVHGVMNTDNTSISGETIDYGPCAFLDEYHPAKTFSSIDQQGRYAFANQPRIAHWNVARLAETLLPLLHESEGAAIELATNHLERFATRFETAHLRVLRAKLGLTEPHDDDRALAADLFERMASSRVDFTVFFRALCGAAEGADADARIASLFEQPGAFHHWAEGWRRRLAREKVPAAERAAAMRRTNPAFVPRNHRIEEAIRAAVVDDNFAPFETLVRVLAKPFDDQPADAHLADPPKPDEVVRQTFCGT
jgi:uncharacterized protein YdiU (UPF0061 family)